MNDKGDKTCPLCTEEMDLTDQQLKPCKCGYEICVWCWNHIMEMAEKDNSGGRCPACQTPYDKEKIVGMAANCERLVAEINSERKLKSQKAKPKTPEGRMHLSNVRVIQRNLVYIIGLPLNLADESLLQRREYFGQYGKVLKVSISRTATGVIQHSSNNSCCVYVTYTKEEEAVRCIQSVHSFVLEGRSLRACFGTTKYCHAWLKNMPCSIPDCLYLHDFGSQEDSFTKDDLVSAFTRSRGQQIIGATNNLHRRSGNALPPPADECTNRTISLMAKPDSKTSSNKNIGNWESGSCLDNGTGRPNAHPGEDSCVMHISSSTPAVTSLSQSGQTPNHKPETLNGPQAFASEFVSTKRYSDVKGTVIPQGGGEGHCVFVTSNDNLPCLPALQNVDGYTTAPPTDSSSLKHTKQPCVASEDKNFLVDGDFQGLCSKLSSIRIGSKDGYSVPIALENSIFNHNLPGSRGSQQDVSYPFSESAASPALREGLITEDLLGLDDQEVEGFGGTCHLPSISSLPLLNPHLNQSAFNHQCTIDAHPSIASIECNGATFPLTSDSRAVLSNGFYDKKANRLTDSDITASYSSVLVESGKCLEELDNNMTSVENKVASNTWENSIISNILSMDFDSWEDSLTSPQSLVKLLAETDKHGSLKVPCLRKVQDSSQSRFSFARQDDIYNQMTDLDHSLDKAANNSSTSHCFVEKDDPCMEKFPDISSHGSSVESNGFLSRHPFTSSSFYVSSTSSSRPPGFSIPSRAVPPGFPTHGIVHHDFDSSANHLLQNSASAYGNVEITNPAIVDVGKGVLQVRLNIPGCDLRPNFSPQPSPFDHDTELQMLMQQSISAEQNLGFSDHFTSRFSSLDDACGSSPTLLGQSPPNKPPAFAQLTAQQRLRNLHVSNGHWAGWNGVKSASDLGMSEFRTNPGLRFNKFIPSYEDSKC